MKHELKMWGELYEDEKVIHHEIKMLSTAHKILVQNEFNRHRNISINFINKIPYKELREFWQL